MFEYLFSIFDIPITCMLILLSMCCMFFIKNIYNVFMGIFTSIFLMILIASTILTQQIYLGEFLVISIFFILVITFFAFNLKNKESDEIVDGGKKFKLPIYVIAASIVLSFAVIGVNFNTIMRSSNHFIPVEIKNENTLTLVGEGLTEAEKEQVYSDYHENISMLNQNRIFQKLTHIIMFYVCLVIALYYFNRRSSDEG